MPAFPPATSGPWPSQTRCGFSACDRGSDARVRQRVWWVECGRTGFARRQFLRVKQLRSASIASDGVEKRNQCGAVLRREIEAESVSLDGAPRDAGAAESCG